MKIKDSRNMAHVTKVLKSVKFIKIVSINVEFGPKTNCLKNCVFLVRRTLYKNERYVQYDTCDKGVINHQYHSTIITFWRFSKKSICT